jgi:hypothetical protein
MGNWGMENLTMAGTGMHRVTAFLLFVSALLA